MLLTHPRHCNAISHMRALERNITGKASMTSCDGPACIYKPLGRPHLEVILMSASGMHLACPHTSRAFHGAFPSVYRCNKRVIPPRHIVWYRRRVRPPPAEELLASVRQYNDTDRLVPAAADGKEQRAGCRAWRDRRLASMCRHPCIHRGLTGPGLRAAAHGRPIRYVFTLY